MVYLDRIYTRGGDAGETSLGDGSRVPKTSRRIVAYGAVDELNAVIGAARAATGEDVAASLATIQNALFDVGAALCELWAAPGPLPRRLLCDRVPVVCITRLIGHLLPAVPRRSDHLNVDARGVHWGAAAIRVRVT